MLECIVEPRRQIVKKTAVLLALTSLGFSALSRSAQEPNQAVAPAIENLFEMAEKGVDTADQKTILQDNGLKLYNIDIS